jgi:hypothetical protein
MTQAKPCWSWTGVAELASSGQDAHLRDLVSLLPVQKSSDEQIVDYLGDLRAHFHRWLHQDEFGPNRREQTASLRALIKSFQSLRRQLKKGSALRKSQLDAAMRSRNDPSSEVPQAIYESAIDISAELQITAASKRTASWAAWLQNRAHTLMAQLQTLDTNTDGEIFLTAARRKFDLSQATGRDFALADAERWLNNYLSVLVETLSDLNRRRGAEERVSLKLLVEQLCELWERETGSRVTAHGQVKDVYTGRAGDSSGSLCYRGRGSDASRSILVRGSRGVCPFGPRQDFSAWPSTGPGAPYTCDHERFRETAAQNSVRERPHRNGGSIPSMCPGAPSSSKEG